MTILDLIKEMLEGLSKEAGPAAVLGGVAGLGVGILLVMNGVFAESTDLGGEPVLWFLAALFIVLGAIVGVGIEESLRNQRN